MIAGPAGNGEPNGLVILKSSHRKKREHAEQCGTRETKRNDKVTSYLGSKRKEVAGRSQGKHALEERRVTPCFWVVGVF